MNPLKIYIGFIIFIFSIGMNAQTFKIDTSSIDFEKKSRPCLLANLDPEARSLQKAWTSYMKKNYEVKFKKTSDKDVLVAKDIIMTNVSIKRMNLYTRIIETTSGSEMKLFSSFGYDFFIGPVNYPIEFEAYRKIMNAFLTQYLTTFYTDEIKATIERINQLDKANLSIKKNIEKNQKKIDNGKKQIASYNAANESDPDKAIKILQKINSLTQDETTLENENAKATLEIMLNNEKLVIRKTKLINLKSKQVELIK